MSNIELIIEERAASLGNFLVGRLLPFRQKRSVGPFVFIDHMGPSTIEKSNALDVGAHPHIGLSTLTYLFEGAILHRDSIGNELEITPGAVNWMTAGKGIVHSERTPERLRNTLSTLHGLQIWVALPKELEETTPSFAHIEEKDIPKWEENGVRYQLIAGEALGKKSPVPVHSSLYFIEVKTSKDTEINLENQLFGESALYILEGEIELEGQKHGEKQLLVAKNSHLCQFTLKAGSTIYIFGGEPFPEPRFIYWNFVSSDKQLIEQAKNDWEKQLFPSVINEKDFIPLPK